MSDKKFRSFVKAMEEELEDQTGRYFTHHIPKNCDDDWGRVYFHEPVLRHLISFKPDVRIGSRFGFYLQVEKYTRSKVSVWGGFNLVHARYQAEILAKNIRTSRVQAQLKALFRKLKPLYKTKEAKAWYSSHSRYQSLQRKLPSADEEFFLNPGPEDVPFLVRDYPVRNRRSTGMNGGKGWFGGCYFGVGQKMGAFPGYSDLKRAVPSLTKDLLGNFNFLHNALFPATYSPRRQTDQNRIMDAYLRKHNLPKVCDVVGCDSQWVQVETHHIVPHCHGGKDDLTNLVNLCHKHHRQCGTQIGKVRKGYLELPDGTRLKLQKQALVRMGKL